MVVSMSARSRCSHFGLAGEGGLTPYLAVLFPPFSSLGRPPKIGELPDDISDILGNVDRGLRLFEAGHPPGERCPVSP